MKEHVIAAVVMLGSATASAGGTVPYNTFFLDRCSNNGCLIQPGTTSSITDRWSINGTRTLSPFPHGDQTWAQVVACVRETFAPFDIVVTDVDPGIAPHFEAKIAGTSAQLGLAGGATSVSSFSCQPFIPQNLVFVFAATIGNDVDELCASAAHELAHTIGLDHTTDPSDPLSLFSFAGRRAFPDADVTCGSDCTGGTAPVGGTCSGAGDQERACTCSGAPTQNSYQALLAAFGPKPVGVVITAPAANALVQPGFAIGANVGGFAPFTVELYIDGALVDTDSSSPFGFSAPPTLGAGTHQVEVRATSANGAEGSSTIEVRIEATEPPMTDGTTGQPGDEEPAPSEQAGCRATRPTGWLVLAAFASIARRRRRS